MMALQRLAPSTNCVASTLRDRDFSSRVRSTLDQTQHFIDSFSNLELNCSNGAVLLSSFQTPRARDSNHHHIGGRPKVRGWLVVLRLLPTFWWISCRPAQFNPKIHPRYCEKKAPPLIFKKVRTVCRLSAHMTHMEIRVIRPHIETFGFSF